MQSRKKPAATENEPQSREELSSDEKRSYYYDDAHGYEDFDPENEDEDEKEECSDD